MTQGLEQIIFSEPLKMHNYERFAWLVYESDELAEAAIADLQTLVIVSPTNNQADDFVLTPSKNNQTATKGVKVAPEMPGDYVARDISLCLDLIKNVFNVQKEPEYSNPGPHGSDQQSDAIKRDTPVSVIPFPEEKII